MRTWLGGLAVLLACESVACEGGPERAPSVPMRTPARVEEWHPEDEPSPEQPLAEVPSEAMAEAVSASSAGVEEARSIEPAAGPDTLYDSDEPVVARRYVYRVRLAIPSVLGEAAELATPAAELYLDVSSERVRARFVGNGWPIEPGAEVRLRGDSPGAYLFSAEGGRPLLPGELALWFEGGPRRPGPAMSIRRDLTAQSGDTSGALVCAFIAEWSGESRDSVARRCDGHAPAGFRVGLWRGERTADVEVEVPRRALRADQAEPPAAIPRATSHAFFEPSSLAHIRRANVRGEEPEGPSDDAPGEGFVFVNETATRVIVTVEGVPVGWIAPTSRGHFVGLAPAAYGVGALRPMGSIALRPRLIQLPTRTTLRAPRHRDDADTP